MSFRNLTLTLPVDLVRRARVIAAKRDTSLSAMISDYLRALTEQDDDYDGLWQRERRVMREGLSMQVGEIVWSRDDTHAR
jgi:hypothetical protein